MTDTALKAIIFVALLVLGGIGIKQWLHNRDVARDNKAIAEQADRTGKATVEIADKGEAAQEQATALDTQIEAQRVEIIHKYEAVRNANQTVRSYTDTPVPRELRDLARERRLARDRLGSDQAGRPRDDGTAPAQ